MHNNISIKLLQFVSQQYSNIIIYYQYSNITDNIIIAILRHHRWTASKNTANVAIKFNTKLSNLRSSL